MAALIVGGYYVEPLKRFLKNKGIDSIEHWVGDKTNHVRRTIPRKTALVLILCDFVNHTLARKVKEEAGRLGLPVFCCRSSLGEIRMKLDRLGEITR